MLKNLKPEAASFSGDHDVDPTSCRTTGWLLLLALCKTSSINRFAHRTDTVQRVLIDYATSKGICNIIRIKLWLINHGPNDVAYSFWCGIIHKYRSKWWYYDIYICITIKTFQLLVCFCFGSTRRRSTACQAAGCRREQIKRRTINIQATMNLWNN